jgi:serine phosphatase RsbU (regulator of sigma subunit)
LRAQPENPDALSNNYVFSIHEDQNGFFWLGTEGGLNRFDPKTGKFRRFSESDGLPDNTIYGILQDNDGFLWLSTSNGLGRFDPSTELCRSFHYMDGLQNNEFNGGAFFRNSRGELFFGGINGFNIITPSRIRENRHRPPVVITDFRKFNQPVDLDVPVHSLREVVLSHRDDMISFGFAALDFTVPNKNQYAYRMEGLSGKWIQTAANRRMATFTSLPAGRYTFRVKGSNNHGVWNHQGVEVAVRVNPPWWRTWWFQLSLLLLVLLTITFSYRLRVREVKQEARLRAELIAAHNAQVSIMPCRSPQIAGYDIAGSSIPASEVGGDFFDYLWADDGESGFAVVVGDVSGKGMKAAMTAVMADGVLSASASQTRDIIDIMHRLNRSLVGKTDRRDFVAIVIASFSGEKLELINSGLPDPLLKRNGQVTWLISEGPRLPPGVWKDRPFTATCHQLRPGDVTLFCSDGVTEAMDRGGQMYGRQRMQQCLLALDSQRFSAREILDAIMADINLFMAGKEARDDITLVVVKKES